MKITNWYRKFLHEMKRAGLKIKDMPEEVAQAALAIHQQALLEHRSIAPMNDNVISLANGYNRRELLQFRNPADIAEMIAHCNQNRRIWFRSLDGTARQITVNGKVRTWKRDPNRVEIPVKYGLYEYGYFTASDLNRVLIPLEVSHA